MKTERGRWPEATPAITLQALETSGDHVLAAGAWWLAGRHRRIDTLLDQFGYERQGLLAWERSLDDRYRVVMAQAYDRDSDNVVGIPLFRELFGDAPRDDRTEGRHR